MVQDERLLHGSSFGAAAAAYAEHRPDYAEAAVRWALEPARGRRRTADSLVAALATRAGMLVMSEHERAATLGRICAFNASRPETAHGAFTVPMRTGVLRVQRLSTARG